MQNSKIQAGTFMILDIPDIVKTDIMQALEMFNEICTGCEGDHQQWAIAGGIVSFLLQKTTTFNDIDLYVNCSKHFKQSETYAVTEIAFGENRPLIQIIRVNFNLDIDKKFMKTLTVWDFFAAYILLNFDMPICRCAFKFVTNKCYVLDMTGFNYVSKHVKSYRLKKYAARVIPHELAIPNLKKQVLFNIFISYGN